MKRILCFIIAFYFYNISYAQNLSITAFGGFSNYQGDLTPTNFTFNQSHIAFGAGLSYQLNNHFNIIGGITYGTISGNDKFNPKNYSRNLNFFSPILDVQTSLEYVFFDLSQQKISPFVFGGLCYFHFNPETVDISGRNIFLQPLSTEGQGFYNGRKPYSLNQVGFPFGLGVRYAVNENIQISAVLSYRKTFTDYLDDVSTTYAPESDILLNRGPEAVALAFRSYELGTGLTYPAAGNQRGNPKNKDMYYFSGITLSYRLHSIENNFSGRKRFKNNTGCPKNVF